MKMKRFLTAVAFVLAILTVGSSAWAFNYNQHVSVAPNGQGDVLVYPLYVAAEGWENSLTVVNTSGSSVVAKLIVRSWVFSEELLDFLIFLSPYDMWIGKIQVGKNGPEMYSTDSSALWTDINSTNPFATESTPLQQKLVAVSCSQDSNAIGYVEVIEAWSGVVNFGTSASDKQKRGKMIYDSYMAAAFPAVTINALAGSFDIAVPSLGMNASAEAVVLKDYDNQIRLTTGQTTYLGDNANNNTREIEAALSKNNIALPFMNEKDATSFHIFTFPTKLSTFAVQTNGSCLYAGSRNSRYFPASQKLGYGIRAFDNEEQTTGSPFSPARNLVMPNEVNIIGVGDIIFAKGWIEVNMPNPAAADVNVAGQGLNFTGGPVIPLVVDIVDGMSVKYVSYQEGVVTGDGGVIPCYQYTSSFCLTN